MERPWIAAPPDSCNEKPDAIEGRTTWTGGGPALCSRGAEKAGRSNGRPRSGHRIALLSFGWIFYAWSIPMLVAFVLLLRAEHRRAAAPVMAEARAEHRLAA